MGAHCAREVPIIQTRLNPMQPPISKLQQANANKKKELTKKSPKRPIPRSAPAPRDHGMVSPERPEPQHYQRSSPRRVGGWARMSARHKDLAPKCRQTRKRLKREASSDSRHVKTCLDASVSTSEHCKPAASKVAFTAFNAERPVGRLHPTTQTSST